MTPLLEILQDIRPECDFSASEDFLADGLLDSMDMVTLVSDLDRTFGISIDGLDIIPEHFANLRTIELLLEKYGVKA
ncbi:acyl carrier protein [Geothrix paludis]|uniref:acyl carrier protein n=1 Tax=Geothrix paludis TaxID=2922722 RepID=UPI001FABE754|nr:acyl carrier protein [Geothrix paludis]